MAFAMETSDATHPEMPVAIAQVSGWMDEVEKDITE
jgi:hypothetical protein